MHYLTGFNTIEEYIKSLSKNNASHSVLLLYSKLGPRAQKIFKLAKTHSIQTEKKTSAQLNAMLAHLPEHAQNHRGLVLAIKSELIKKNNFDELLAYWQTKDSALVLILDRITDLHNIGAIIRTADQFGVDGLILPKSRSANIHSGNIETIMRISSGASAWVSTVSVPNLVQAVKLLKKHDFWIYAADISGTPLPNISFAKKTAIIMGNEGKGIAPFLQKSCDATFTIPTCGHVDSLNVSVATGVILYDARLKINALSQTC